MGLQVVDKFLSVRSTCGYLLGFNLKYAFCCVCGVWGVLWAMLVGLKGSTKLAYELQDSAMSTGSCKDCETKSFLRSTNLPYRLY